MAKPERRIYIHIVGLIIVLIAAGYGMFAAPETFSVQYEKLVAHVDGSASGTKEDKSKTETSGQTDFKVTHIKTPDAVKSIYMSQCVVGTRDFRQKLVNVADTTEVNSIIIDIKDYTGRLAFTTDNSKISHAVSDDCGAVDMKEFIGTLHEKGIYVIGRITVFQDPYMSALKPHLAVRKLSDGGVWKDNKGLSFIDVGAKEHWDYIIEISKEAYRIGFDELNYDYIRFPSDGNMKDTSYTLSQGKTKPVALEEFFVYLDNAMNTGEFKDAVLSADLFGMVNTNRDDLNIGQVLERALPHFDYIAPMVYPSHYPPTFNGWADPNDYPYELIKYVMTAAVEKANAYDHSFGTSTPDSLAKYNAESYKKLRPWLQDFDYGGDYDVAEVRAQIKGTYDAGLNSWMLWAPSNIYTVGALDK